MEEESFEDLEIAETLNRLFVPIKVDREERPDVDSVYMQAVQLLTQHGGWPMSVFLTPDRKPFYGGTYFPPRDGVRGARVGFLSLLGELHRVYTQERGRAADAAEQISRAVKESLAADRPTSAPGLHVLHGAMSYFSEVFDPAEGGVRRAPKFPSSLHTRFLLRYAHRTGDEQALRMATLTLTKMALGGIYDQVGGGFHRYSTDARWLVPHRRRVLPRRRSRRAGVRRARDDRPGRSVLVRHRRRQRGRGRDLLRLDPEGALGRAGRAGRRPRRQAVRSHRDGQLRGKERAQPVPRAR
jgi:uncharacterized protein YyaL (SSP411 family)